MAAPEAATAADADPSAGASARVEHPRRALAVVVGVVFIDLVGFGVIVPILPFYVRSFGVSDVLIGLLAATYSLAQFGFAPFLGRLSDERGRRPVLMLSLAGATVAWLVFGMAGEMDELFGVPAAVATLFASRFLAGAMGGNIAAAQAYVADITPPERRAGALGLIGASFALGFVFGPAIGGIAASEAVVTRADAIFPRRVPTTPYSLPSFAAAAMSATSLACAALFLEEPRRDRTPARRETVVRQFVDALEDATLRPLVIAFFVVSVAFSGVQVMFIPFAADIYGYGPTETAMLLTYIGVLGALNQGLLVGRLSKRYPSRTIALGGAGALAAALAAIPFSPAIGRALVPASLPGFLEPELVALLAVLGALSLGNGLLNVALSTLVSLGASVERQGRAFGVTQGAGSLGRTVGPPVMAGLYVLAHWTPFVAGAILVVPAFGLIFGLARARGRGATD